MRKTKSLFTGNLENSCIGIPWRNMKPTLKNHPPLRKNEVNSW